MNYMELDTPALIIDREIMMDNLRFMQEYADRRHVALRPHTKTHKMPRLALIQEELGARGVTVAKVGEAEVMAEAGLRDIFIANEIVGESKLARIRELAKTVDISFGLDSIPQAEMIERAFAGAPKPARVLIEIE
ncbi:alanine racemase, partial [Enterocloster asparagiformis]